MVLGGLKLRSALLYVVIICARVAGRNVEGRTFAAPS
jgi:hypothetical protein